MQQDDDNEGDAPLARKHRWLFVCIHKSACDPTPDSIRLFAQCARLKTHAPDFSSSAPASSFRRVKRLTHIAPALQARRCSTNASKCALNTFCEIAALGIFDRGRRRSFQIRHSAQGGAADLPRILRQCAAARIGFGGRPRSSPSLQLSGAHVQRDFATLCINRYVIAGFHQRQRTAERRLGRHVPHHEAMAAAGKTPVRQSVTRATSLPSPLPMMAPVGLSISRIPGPPLGPS